MSTNGNGEVTPHRDRPRKELVHFAPGSLHLDELQAGRIAELGGFVIRPGVERSDFPHLLDALTLALLQLTDPTIASFTAPAAPPSVAPVPGGRFPSSCHLTA